MVDIRMVETPRIMVMNASIGPRGKDWVGITILDAIIGFLVLNDDVKTRQTVRRLVA